ncbi:unnamed protein product [Fusarium venenatum]|uniref:Uncharacterized protein n=1 Tax=Fusarium venenatum TaxID=56646 RepID=A0A2L2SYB4_9HYPO|nr:uncharacterized protein FVRRES_07440 [Fusarium venenatum]CEI63004.1 unnamed protein product [Fusarium venenatum]
MSKKSVGVDMLWAAMDEEEALGFEQGKNVIEAKGSYLDLDLDNFLPHYVGKYPLRYNKRRNMWAI